MTKYNRLAETIVHAIDRFLAKPTLTCIASLFVGLYSLIKIRLAAWQLALLATLFIIAANNSALFRSLGERLDLLSLDGISFVLTIVVLMVVVVNTLFLIIGTGWLLKATIALLLVSSAAFGYFSNNLGVAFDEGMFLNIADTVLDRNTAEATELASLPMILHVLAFGIVPALTLVFISVDRKPFFREFRTRAVTIVAGVVLLAGVAMPNYKYVSYFGVENRDLRFKVTPIFPMMSLYRVTRDYFHVVQPFRVIDADASRKNSSARRVVGIMVVGETARADHFSLNGYGKQTNPQLEATHGLMYSHGDSCGTSTIYSVPCMFSLRGHDTYSPESAGRESNVLDVLTSAGVQTVWIDNNSSCKHVCDRIENLNLRQHPDESSPFYSDNGFYDEALLQNIDAYLDNDDRDLLLVLHTLGSHGPAYSRRYPPGFAVFQPYCDEASPQECSDEEVSNAYDNTIVYTDFILSQLIKRLNGRRADFDSFLFYASDHGESLGENGVYLHGLPRAIAPVAQTDVPFIVWMSQGFRASHNIDTRAGANFRRQELTHDNISHSLLGFFDVSAESYRADEDAFPGRRGALELDAG